MQLRAPAKVNLSFRIQHRRPDGFHEIETLMTPISLCDQLTIERNDEKPRIRFSCDDALLSTSSDNLVLRAAELFFKHTKRKAAVEIVLKKKIPHGAGLGGGSSDAATTLVGLNRLFETNLAREKLVDLAAQIGSDIPFFVYESAALCRGRGEIVAPMKLAQELSILLIKPGFSVSTSWAYSRWQDSRELPKISYAPQDFAGVQFVNDLERPVFEKFVFLAEIKTWLRRQPEVGAALLSGSGSTVFAVLKNAADADALAKRAAELDPELWVCACKTIAPT
jgi:4-diphosphocytidyl-2-C-methyl-D-erythritol kinase